MAGLGSEAETPRRGRNPRILFVALANDVGTDRLPAALAALGAECAALCPPGYYCAAPHGMRRWFPLPSHHGLWLAIPFLRPRLEAACREWGADLVVPLDNVSAQCLRVIATSPSITSYLRLLLQNSFGAPSGYHAACSRSGLMRFADQIGINLPKFTVSADPAVMRGCAEDWGYPVVLKAENTCGGHGVTIARTAEALNVALANLRQGSVGRRARRALGRGFWRLAGLRGTAGTPPLLQSFAPGIPAMRTVSTWRGKVLEGVSFAAERVHPAPTGPSTTVRFVENAEMSETARRLIAALGCSGFMSLDFMLDEATGRAALIEVNPRPIGTTHLGRLFGHDACAPLLACLNGERPALAPLPLSAPRTVALFPKEIERDPRNLRRLFADEVHHDVPSDEPRVMAMYLHRLSRIHPKDIPAIRDALGTTEAAATQTSVTLESRDRGRATAARVGAFAQYP
jgi:hypothetical protein